MRGFRWLSASLVGVFLLLGGAVGQYRDYTNYTVGSAYQALIAHYSS